MDRELREWLWQIGKLLHQNRTGLPSRMQDKMVSLEKKIAKLLLLPDRGWSRDTNRVASLVHMQGVKLMEHANDLYLQVVRSTDGGVMEKTPDEKRTERRADDLKSVSSLLFFLAEKIEQKTDEAVRAGLGCVCR